MYRERRKTKEKERERGDLFNYIPHKIIFNRCSRLLREIKEPIVYPLSITTTIVIIDTRGLSQSRECGALINMKRYYRHNLRKSSRYREQCACINATI